MKSYEGSLAEQSCTDESAEATLALARPAAPPAAPSEARRTRRRAESAPAGATPFGPDVILPEQFYDRPAGLEEVSGERALMLAVLEDGIRCFQEHIQSPHVRPRLLARQAEKWIRSQDWDWPFSFNNVCESLSLDPDSLRAAILRPNPDGPPTKPRPSTHRVYRLTPRVKPPRRR